MNCPKCNYLLTDESKPCPKCREIATRYGTPPHAETGAPPYGAAPPPANWQQHGPVPGQAAAPPQAYGHPPMAPDGGQFYPSNPVQGQPYPQQGYAPQQYGPPGYGQPPYQPGAQPYAGQPAYGAAPPPYGYGPQAMQGQTVVPVTLAQARKRNWIIGGSVMGFFVVIMALGQSGEKKHAPAPTNGQSAVAAPVVPTVRIGPSFSEVDGKMDGRLSKWTDAQKEAYWQSVAGSQVTWSGEVVEVELKKGGTLTLKCNSETWSSDTDVQLDGSQVEQLARINKGQRITVRAILDRHGDSGYDLSGGQVIGL